MEYRVLARSFTSITDVINILKCIAITWVCLYLGRPDLYADDTFLRILGLTVFSIPLGSAFGAIAGCLRSDRFLVILATELFAMFFVAGWQFNESNELFAILPWTVGGSVACAWFTRHREAPPVPLARWRQRWPVLPRLRWRVPTVVETAALASIIAALAIAPAIEQQPVTDIGFLALLALTTSVLLPVGVILGVIARSLTTARILIVSLIAMAGAASAAGYASLMDYQPPTWSLGVLALIVLAIEVAIRGQPED